MFKIKRWYLSAVFCSLIFAVQAQSTLEVKILNLSSDKGQVLLELFDVNEQRVRGVKQPIKNKQCIIKIDSLADAQYAFRFFHDANKNDELDTNWMGIPKEAYGFSNDAYGKFGPKDFEEWLFEVKGNTKVSPKISE